MGNYYGKYRGTVIDNADPMQMGRLMVQVPDVSNVVSSTWAMPCAPFSGSQSGVVCVPPTGASVWVEFEQGDSDYPIWSGCFWGSSDDVPSMALGGPPSVQSIVIQSVGGHILMISDVQGSSGGILLKTSSGASIAINDTGITLDNGQGATVTLSGSSVKLNDDALVVT